MDPSKLKLTLLLLIAVLPISLATWVFNTREGSGISSTTNKGTLISPVLDVTDLDMRTAEGELIYRTFEEEVADLPPEDYKPRPWLLVTLGEARCEGACEERLYYLRQIHRRLGAESRRVQRYYLRVGEGVQPLAQATRDLFERDFPGLEVAYADRSEIFDNLGRTLPQEADRDAPVSGHYTYVVDPVGNVMLYFTPDNDPEEILQDVEKLLDSTSLG